MRVGWLADWRFWLCLLLATAGAIVFNEADGSWWGGCGMFAIGVAVAKAYFSGRRS